MQIFAACLPVTLGGARLARCVRRARYLGIAGVRNKGPWVSGRRCTFAFCSSTWHTVRRLAYLPGYRLQKLFGLRKSLLRRGGQSLKWETLVFYAHIRGDHGIARRCGCFGGKPLWTRGLQQMHCSFASLCDAGRSQFILSRTGHELL